MFKSLFCKILISHLFITLTGLSYLTRKENIFSLSEKNSKKSYLRSIKGSDKLSVVQPCFKWAILTIHNIKKVVSHSTLIKSGIYYV